MHLLHRLLHFLLYLSVVSFLRKAHRVATITSHHLELSMKSATWNCFDPEQHILTPETLEDLWSSVLTSPLSIHLTLSQCLSNSSLLAHFALVAISVFMVLLAHVHEMADSKVMSLDNKFDEEVPAVEPPFDLPIDVQGDANLQEEPPPERVASGAKSFRRYQKKSRIKKAVRTLIQSLLDEITDSSDEEPVSDADEAVTENGDVGHNLKTKASNLSALGGEAPPTPLAGTEHDPAINYRVEVYNLGRRSGRVLRQIVEHEEPMKTTIEYDRSSYLSSIFQVTTMYGKLPKRKARNRTRRKDAEYARVRGRSSSDDDTYEVQPYTQNMRIAVRTELGTILKIRSSMLLDAIREVVARYPDMSYEGDFLVLPEPFCLLHHYRQELEAYCNSLRVAPGDESVSGAQTDLRAHSQPEDVAVPELSKTEYTNEKRSHLTALLDFMSDRYSTALREETDRHSLPQPTCTFQWTWLLFKPGSIVYTWDDDVLTACLVESHDLKDLFKLERRSNRPGLRTRHLRTGQNVEYRHRLEAVIIKLCYLEFDGEYLGARKKSISISPFDGERAISSLPAFPPRFCKDHSMRERMIRRGKVYHSITKRAHLDYHGKTASPPQRMLHSRVIIDSTTFYNDRKFGYYKRPRLRLPHAAAEDSSDSDVMRAPRRDSASDSNSSDSNAYNYRQKLKRYRAKVKAVNRRVTRPDSYLDFYLLKPQEKKPLTDDLYMMCTRKVWGFILREREWGMCLFSYTAVEKCTLPEWL